MNSVLLENGFSALENDELFYVNGGSSGTAFGPNGSMSTGMQQISAPIAAVGFLLDTTGIGAPVGTALEVVAAVLTVFSFFA